MKKYLVIFASLLVLSGCKNSTKKSLGLTETLPDEYQVSRSKGIEVPPHYKNEKSQRASNAKSALSKKEQALLNKVEK